MHEVIAPALGMASTEVVLAEWVKQPGDEVSVGDVVAQIETDKAELDVEATAAGTLGRHLWAAGAAVPNGAVIVHILEDGETDPGAEPAAAPMAPAAAGSTPGEPTALAAAPSSTPAPERTAPPTEVDRTPPPPRPRERDAAGDLVPFTESPRQRSEPGAEPATTPAAPAVPAPAAPAAPPAPPAPPAAPSSRPAAGDATDRHRAAVSAAVSRSWAEIPHFAVTSEIDVERLDGVLRAVRAVQPAATFTDVLVKAYALALVDRLGTLDINLGLAVATSRGVAMPVIEGAARASLLEIASLRADAVARAREGRSVAADAGEQHSAISNLGAYGVRDFTGIIPAGRTSLLTVGAAAPRPVVRDGELAVGKTMFATLNVDHRSWDGQHAGEVLQRLAAIAAEPGLLLAL